MEKKEKPRTGFLLGIIVLLSVSVGILHGRKMPGGPTQKETITVSDLFDMIDPLLLSHSFDAVGKLIQQFDEQTVVDALTKIAQPTYSNLSKAEKINLLINSAFYSQGSLRNKIFSLIANDYPVDPVFLIAAADGKGELIPSLVAWANNEKKKVLEKWIDVSLEHSIARNSIAVLNALYDQKIVSSKERASELLYQVVHTNKDPRFVAFLVETLNADPNYSFDKKHTLLIEAVQNKNKQLVRALIDAGANPTLILNDEVGTAKQIAYEKGFVEIERMLDQAMRAKDGGKK